jgi:hypothetical protein
MIATLIVFALMLGAWLALIIAGKPDEAERLYSGLGILTFFLLDQLGATVLKRTGRTSLWSRAPVDVDEDIPTKGRGVRVRPRPQTPRRELDAHLPSREKVMGHADRREFTTAIRLAREKDDPILLREVEAMREAYRSGADRRRGEDGR